MDLSTVVVTGALDAPDEPSVVVIYARLGAKWEQVFCSKPLCFSSLLLSSLELSDTQSV